MDEIITIREAALFLKKHPDTIRRWVREKKLPAKRLSAGKNGIFVILRSDMLERVVTLLVEKKTKAKTPKILSPSGSPQIKLPM